MSRAAPRIPRPMRKHEVHLARHALGLAYGGRRAYRNRFAATYGTPDHVIWRQMVDAGYALRWPWRYSYGDHFALTAAGIAAALKRGESGDPDIYPQESAA